MNNVLVTGANGFIAQYLIPALQQNKYRVLELTSAMGNIADAATWQNLPPANVVLHLAAKTFVPDSWQNPIQFINTNVNGTLQALEYCKQHNARLIFISSYLYGNPTSLPINEQATIYTPNPYALSKKMAEDVCRFYATSYGVPVTIIRPFNIYGPHQPASFLIPTIIQQAIKKMPITVKDLVPKRDYIFINDFIDAVLKSIDLKNNFTVLNIGSGTSYSVADLITTIQYLLQTNVAVISLNQQRQDEIMDTMADISKAKHLLNWQPTTNIQQGLQAIINSCKLG